MDPFLGGGGAADPIQQQLDYITHQIQYLNHKIENYSLIIIYYTQIVLIYTVRINTTHIWKKICLYTLLIY